MGFLRERVVGRFPLIGRLADVAIVGNAGLRLAHRKGLIGDEAAAKFGATKSSGGTGLSAPELAMVMAAAWRLFGRSRIRRQRRRV
jgi:hypothetical protein